MVQRKHAFARARRRATRRHLVGSRGVGAFRASLGLGLRVLEFRDAWRFRMSPTLTLGRAVVV